MLAEAEGFEAMVRAAESNPAIAIQYKMVDQWKEIAGEQVKAFEHMNLGNITVFDGGNGSTSNFLNTLVKTVAPSLGVLDKLPIGETVKGIIHPENKTEEKTEEKSLKKYEGICNYSVADTFILFQLYSRGTKKSNRIHLVN